jgi:cytochrome P450
MPEFEDKWERLPALRAVVKEVLGWRPVTAGGIPRMTTKNDIYERFWIPKGTNVHGNQW